MLTSHFEQYGGPASDRDSVYALLVSGWDRVPNRQADSFLTHEDIFPVPERLTLLRANYGIIPVMEDLRRPAPAVQEAQTLTDDIQRPVLSRT